MSTQPKAKKSREEYEALRAKLRDSVATAGGNLPSSKTELSLKLSGSTYAKAFGAALVTGFAGSAIAHFGYGLALWSGFAAMSAAYIPVIAIGVAVVALATVEGIKNFYKGGQNEELPGKPVDAVKADAVAEPKAPVAPVAPVEPGTSVADAQAGTTPTQNG